MHTSLVTSKCPQTDESVNTSVTQVTIYDGPSDEETTMTSTAVLAESEVVISSRASSCGSSASVEEFRVHGAASTGSLEAPRLLSSLPPCLNGKLLGELCVALMCFLMTMIDFDCLPQMLHLLCNHS